MTKKMTSLEMVCEFHTVYDCPINDASHLKDDALNQLRDDLIGEELTELRDAMADDDPVEVFDALCDLQYVVDGAFLALGFHRAKDDGMAEVHRSNLSKLDENGDVIRRDDGKILKGPNFSEPALSEILLKHGII